MRGAARKGGPYRDPPIRIGSDTVCTAELGPGGVVEEFGIDIDGDGLPEFSMDTGTEILPGDFDYDGDLDEDDVVIFSGAYHARDGEPGYRADCDMDLSGKINIDDFALWYREYKSQFDPGS